MFSTSNLKIWVKENISQEIWQKLRAYLKYILSVCLSIYAF